MSEQLGNIKMHSVADLTKILGLHRNTVISLIHKNELVGIKVGNQKWKVSEKQLQNYIDKKEKERTAV